MAKINIMLVEDHNIVREGLKRLIDMEEGMTVVAEAGSCREALANLREDVNIVLLDIKLPDGDGLELCDIVKKKVPGIKFIALTTYDDALFIRKALESGVQGFIPKYASFDEIKSAITITLRDGKYLYPGLGLEVLMNLSEPGLSESEINILQMIANGETQKKIAAELFISISTLRRRIKGICTKLGVDTIEEALASAVKKGLIE
ncbi:response regulator transcription factor [Desulfoscipio geothermicus]|jgi:DNA-binding NarL/FixJ family response regulator|uniref:Stage 0 sporulation protein A homolog n=1 Tax=Desulfoscipio geothermicus DSM 3669 TaxID=1121426 RepID=A0A1I6E7K9_9FIRM|nr:response regulator transcription factor [Desulfoscipio geothermicus]SFR13532.1 two component transcriptional regulator, LuxR family [Desulfoscipio geothermicus DSM 3669]